MMNMAEMQTDQFSIWIVPSGDFYSEYKRIIQEFSKEFGTPEFDPHVTLLGGLTGTYADIFEKTKQLAALLKPYLLELENFGYEDYYFRSLYIKVRQSEKVMEAYKTAIKVFKVPDPQPYMPHLSLLYGNISLAEKRAATSRIQFEVNRSFRVDQLSLYLVSGKVNEWRVVGNASLSE